MASNADDGFAYRIQLTRLDPAPRTTWCDTCRSRSAIFELGWLDRSRPTRGICQHCVDEELDVRQFNIAREMGRLLEAERNADSASLARMADFYEEWWNRKTPP